MPLSGGDLLVVSNQYFVPSLLDLECEVDTIPNSRVQQLLFPQELGFATKLAVTILGTFGKIAYVFFLQICALP